MARPTEFQLFQHEKSNQVRYKFSAEIELFNFQVLKFPNSWNFQPYRYKIVDAKNAQNFRQW